MRFVVLKHSRQGCQTHYDLMIEQFEGSEKLFTFSLSLTPRELMASGCAEGKKIFDHDRRFLDYEGPVNKEQGNVVRVDQGTVEMQDFASHNAASTTTRYIFNGTYLNGTFDIYSADGACRLQKIISD